MRFRSAPQLCFVQVDLSLLSLSLSLGASATRVGRIHGTNEFGQGVGMGGTLLCFFNHDTHSDRGRIHYSGIRVQWTCTSSSPYLPPFSFWLEPETGRATRHTRVTRCHIVMPGGYYSCVSRRGRLPSDVRVVAFRKGLRRLAAMRFE